MTDSNQIYQTRLALFNTTASRYDERIMPAFGPLARRLVNLANLKAADVVLDLGCGTGAVAFLAGRQAGQVVGVDYAAAMLAVARQKSGPGGGNRLLFYQGDMHRLPHRAGLFSVAIASFGFNGVNPGRVFAEIRRLLRPEGRLVFQEWGEIEPASKIVKQAVKAHKVEQATGFLADLRRLAETPDAWDELADEEDIARLLRRTGFRKVDILVEREAIPFTPLDFFNYKTAWTPYQAELAAMSPEGRRAVQTEVVNRLNAWTGPDGRFIWRPELVRIIARK